MVDNKLKIAIVGAGFSGLATATQLSKKFAAAKAAGSAKHEGIEITLLDPRNRAGGYTYNRHDVKVPMANPVGILGLDTPDDFLKHMNQNPGRWSQIADDMGYEGLEFHEVSGFNPQSFVTHNILGEYLNDKLDDLLTADKGDASSVSVEIKHGVEVTDAMFDSEMCFAKLSDDSVLESHVLVLATGNVEPRPIEGLEGHDGYYNLDDRGLDLETVHETDTTVIVGAGNGAGFAVCSALANGYEGTFILSCHEAKMPAVLGESKPYERKVFTVDALREIHSERGQIVVDDLINLFRQEHRQAHKDGYSWRDVVDSIVPDANDMWRMLEEDQKVAFFRQYGYVWGHARYRMPEYHAEILESMIARGRLDLKPGEKSIVPDTENGGFIITRETGDPDNPLEQYHTSKVVNIRGPSGKIEHMSEVMRSMLSRGEIDEHPLGGIKVDDDMRAVNADGKSQERLYGVGPILRGEFVEAMTIPAIRDLAPKLADSIISDHTLSNEEPS